MEEKVFRYIRTQALLEAGDDVTVALSGGADSVALLWVLKTLAPRLGLTLRAAHFHHGIRGAEADRDEAFCRALCQSWEVPFLSGRGDAPARAAATGESLEEAARVLRYEFLLGTAPGLVATAHNADDNAETLLSHLLRGTGLRGLGGIPPKRDRIVRPLLSCSRAEIGALLEREGLPHMEDSSNECDDCLRNRLRHRVLPLLRAENPALSATLGRTAALVRAEDEYLSRLAARAAEDCRAGEGWSCERLLALDPVLRRRVLGSALWSLGVENPSAVCVRSLEELLRAGPSARLDLPDGLRARREYDRLLLGGEAEPAPLPELSLRIPGDTVLPGEQGRIRCFVTKNSNFSKKNLTTFALKYDMIAAHELKVRGRRPGDRLRLSGGGKSLKALMIDRKLPARLRASLPVLTLDGKPVAVFHLGADPAYLAAQNEQALVISLIPGA
jgi:tRNA(Ile)-lysidine synthase